MKKLLSVVLALLLILSVSACSAPGNSSQTPAEPTKAASEGKTTEPEKIDLRIMWWGSQTRHDRPWLYLTFIHRKTPI